MSEGRDEGALSLGVDPWRELEASVDWDRLVLPAGLRDRLGALAGPRWAEDPGTRVVLFGGPRGAGKTCVARSLGARLRVPVLEADVAAVIAGDPATALARVDRLFDAAATRRGVLVLDRADAVLRRPRETGPDANPAAVHLMRLDCDRDRPLGIVIVCAETARQDHASLRMRVDEAFVFPELTAGDREAVWRRHLPDDHRVPGTEMSDIARAFRLSAAAIARCAHAATELAAAHDGPVGLVDVAGGLESEYRGRLTSDATRAALAALSARARRDAPAPRNTFVSRSRHAPAPTRARSRRRRAAAALALGGASAALALGLLLAPRSSPAPPPAPPARHASLVPPTAQIAYADGLDVALRTLNRARVQLGAQLTQAGTPSAQATAATALASAHLQAAAAIAALNAGAAAPVNRTLSTALRGAARAYVDLARAARTRDATRYARAGQALRDANASVNAALGRLRTLGNAGR